MRSFIIKPGDLIPIGRAGENQATQIRFDVTGWAEAFGAGAYALVVKRPHEDTAYPVEVTTDGDYVVWTVSNVDTGIAGNASVQLRYVVDGALAKSVIYTGIVGESLDNIVDPPDPFEDLIQRMVDLTERTEAAATSAAGSAASASESAGTATAAKNAAEAANTAAQSAKTAAQSANTDAQSAKTAAQSAKNAAEAAQSAAAQSATAASGSATAAAGSATQAAASATAADASADAAAAAAATLTLDATLTSATQAAQAKAVGDGLTIVNKTFDNTVFRVGATVSPISWESGTINSGTGGKQNNAKRIRTNAFRKTADMYSIKAATGYRLELIAYNLDDSYVGIWDGTTFVKSSGLTSAEIVMIDKPDTYQYKIMLDSSTVIDASYYTNCIVRYKDYVDPSEITPQKWDDSYDMVKTLQSGLLPYLSFEKGTIGSSGQKVSSTTVVRTPAAVKFENDTFIRCINSDYYYAIRAYSAEDITEENFIGFWGSYYGTFRLYANTFYCVTVAKRDGSTVDNVDTYSKQIEVWSQMYLESMRKYEYKRFTPFGNSRRKIIGHKGITTNAPENTIPSFEAAGIGNAWGIETDINATSDGYLVCIHDTTLDRTTTGTGAVNEHTLAEIRALSIKDHPELKVPTVEEFIGICKMYDCVPVFELKNMATDQAMVTKLINTIVDYGFESKAVILCSQYSIGHVQCINHKIPCIFIIDPTDINTEIDRAKRYFNTNVTIASGTYSAVINHELISQLHNAGVSVNIGGVNTEEEIKAYFAMGADSVSSDFISTY